ncbi:MAG: GT4 family glycosyltransferase PelF [Balneolaceae bacterium]
MAKKKPIVLFGTEGSYPFSGGGVSTWAHILCSELAEKIDFYIFTITGNPFVESRYKLTDNVKRIIHVPLWGVEEPVEYYDDEKPFSYQIAKKARTTPEVVKRLYMPLFRDFINILFDPFQDPRRIGEIIYGMWKYFDLYDYKLTMREPGLWIEFKSALMNEYKDTDHTFGDEPKVFDVTFGMRWLYHFLMPLASPIPEEVDITHSTLAGFPALVAIAAKYEYGTPSIVTDHGVYIRERLINVGRADMPFFSKKLLVNLATMVTRAVYFNSDQISPVTTANKKWELKFEAPESSIAPIYNGVDTDIFKPTSKPSHTADKPTVIAVAQVFALKDIETMIRTCDIVRKEIPDVQFIVYGSLDVDPEYVQMCRDLIKELGVDDYFKFGGFHNQPSMIFNEGDISILTSISEGFPYTVIESMSCGRPVVATDVGGIKDALEGCGILCKPRYPQGIADGVIKLLTDTNLRLELGKKAREKVLINFTTEKSVDAYYEAYNKLLEKPKIPLKDQIQEKSVLALLEEMKEVNEQTA